jgi:hypothetical protein
MQPVQRNPDHCIAAPSGLHASVQRHATRLERFHDRIAAGRRALERWHQHHGQDGNVAPIGARGAHVQTFPTGR